MNKTKLKKLLKYLFIAFLCFNLFNLIRFRWSDAQIAEVEKALRDVNMYECDFSVRSTRSFDSDNFEKEDIEVLNNLIKSAQCQKTPNTYRSIGLFQQTEEGCIHYINIEINMPGMRNLRIGISPYRPFAAVKLFNDFPYYYLIMYERAWASVDLGEAEYEALKDICNVPK